jgi:hypothetical protein
MTRPATARRGRPTTAPLATALVLAAAAVAFAPAAGGGLEGQDSSPAARSADVATIDAIISALYDVISGPVGEPRDWDRFRALFLPEGRLIPTSPAPDGGAVHQVITPAQYAAGSGPRLEAMGFREHEIARRVERFGAIAHVFSTYEGFRGDETEPFLRGINSIQLFHDGARWWILTVFWSPEHPGAPLPAEYLPGTGAVAEPTRARMAEPSGPGRLAAPAELAVARYHAGITATLGVIPSPFDWRCDTEVVERAMVSGVEAHASVTTGRLDFTGRVVAATEMGTVVCPDIPRVREDGVYTVNHHHGDVDGDWLQAVEVMVGFSPARVPYLRAAAGGGWIRDADAPFGTATVGVRLGDRLRFLGDAGLHLGSTPYFRVRETWQDFELVRTDHVGQGRSWAVGPVVRVGVEARLR